MSDQLEIRERVLKDSIGERAVDPQRFSIRSHPDTMRRHPSPGFRNSETAGLIRQLDPGHLCPFLEVDNSESVKSGKLNENATGRAIGVFLEGHGTYRAVEFDFPCHCLGVEINHRCGFIFDRTTDSIFAIWRDEHIMDGAIHGYALYLLERGRVDYIEDAGLRPDANQDLTSIFRDGNVVRPATHRYLF